jgi:hypothetical protein
MNSDIIDRPVWHFGINYVVACLLFVALTVGLVFSVPVPAINADRADARSKALAEIRATEAAALTTPGWSDKNRGLVRLPIATAMALAEKAAANPAAARADLIARAAKAVAPLEKKPSSFE